MLSGYHKPQTYTPQTRYIKVVNKVSNLHGHSKRGGGGESYIGFICPYLYKQYHGLHSLVLTKASRAVGSKSTAATEFSHSSYRFQASSGNVKLNQR